MTLNLTGLAAQKEKARAMYDAERAKTHNLIDVLEEAQMFVSHNTEPWYYSGNLLLGKLESVIAALWDKEYADYLAGAKAQGLANVYSFEQYQDEARKYSAKGA